MTLEELKRVMFQKWITLALCVFSHLTSWAFTHKCTGRFAQSVRSRVLRGILRQDTVFFDVYPSGVIQVRRALDGVQPGASPLPTSIAQDVRAGVPVTLLCPASFTVPAGWPGSVDQYP